MLPDTNKNEYYYFTQSLRCRDSLHLNFSPIFGLSNYLTLFPKWNSRITGWFFWLLNFVSNILHGMFSFPWLSIPLCLSPFILPEKYQRITLDVITLYQRSFWMVFYLFYYILFQLATQLACLSWASDPPQENLGNVFRGPQIHPKKAQKMFLKHNKILYKNKKHIDKIMKQPCSIQNIFKRKPACQRADLLLIF